MTTPDQPINWRAYIDACKTDLGLPLDWIAPSDDAIDFSNALQIVEREIVRVFGLPASYFDDTTKGS